MRFLSRRVPKFCFVIVITLSLFQMSFLFDATSQSPALNPDTRSGYSWLEVGRLERDVVVEKGGQTFVRFDNGTGALSVTDEIDYYDALSSSARQAVDRAPVWLRENLSRKLAYAGIEDHRTGQKRLAFGDLDGDGDMDMLACRPGKLLFYLNCGTRYVSLFGREDDLFDLETISSMNNIYSPSFGDLDADGDLDLVIGGYNELILFENTGSTELPAFGIAATIITSSGMRVPSALDLNGDGYSDLVVGKEDGSLEYWVNGGSGELNDFQINRLLLAAINVGGDAYPTGGDLDGDGDIDLVIGSSSTILHHFSNVGSSQNPLFTVDDLTLFSGIGAGIDLVPSIVVLETDELPDLVLTSSMNRTFFYDNVGTTHTPAYRISSTYEVWPGRYYYPPNILLKVVDERSISDLVDLLLSCPDHLVDEIAFSISFTSDNVLLANEVVPEMFLENARYIYETAPYLEYVDLVEIGDFNSGDYYTTTRYRIVEDGIEKEVTLPRDMYYKFVVHPKVTEEIPLFINPETGDHDDPYPEGNGRFWREYLFYHNDTSYPSDPDPADELDRYPTDMFPPLLKDVLSGVSVLFNSTTHSAPGGRSVYYGENAVIRVSNWVGKTLILNQQEVSDDERPTQPVRIARTHNGNCGELQDLTIAAARCALIPASGIILLAEDHVWIEFWERGWHQWDNYWSDSGSIIDNFDNYWYNWGGRGGSGIYKSLGNDMIEDVTTHYVPREVLSDVIVKVSDRNGEPVDGARVVIGSHWLIEHSADTPVTAPFPSIWNYTDSDGMARFTLSGNNISVKIISRLGNGAVPKTYIDPGTRYEFNVTLEGEKPRPRPKFREVNPPAEGDWLIEYDMEVVGAYQRPPDANSGSVHTRPIGSGLHMDFAVVSEVQLENVMGNRQAEAYRVELDTRTYGGSIYTDGEEGIRFMVRNCDQVETYKEVRLNIVLYRKVEIFPFVSIVRPTEGEVYRLDEDIPVEGIAVDQGYITELNLTVDSISMNLVPYLSGGNFACVLERGSLEEGMHTLEVIATNDQGYSVADWVSIHVSSLVPPKVDIVEPANGSWAYLGENARVRGTITGSSIRTLELKVTGPDVHEIMDILYAFSNGSFDLELNTSGYREGTYNLTVRAVDATNLVGKDQVAMKMKERADLVPPDLAILSPKYNQKITLGERITVNGTVLDNIGVTELSLAVDDGSSIDILRTLDDGKYSYILETGGLAEGTREIIVEAADRSQNRARDTVKIILEEPYVEPPEPSSIYFLDPEAFSVFELGDEISVKAMIMGEVDIGWIEYSLDEAQNWNGGMEHFNPSTKTFYYRFNSTYQMIGLLRFFIRIVDVSGEEVMEKREFEIQDTTSPKIFFGVWVEDESYTNNDNLLIIVHAQDLSPIKEIVLTMNGPGYSRVHRARQPDIPHEFNINLESLPPGIYEATVTVRDAEGNLETATISFRIATIQEDDEETEKRENNYVVFIGIAILVGILILVGIVWRLLY